MTEAVVPVSVILGDQMRLGKVGMRSVSSLDAVLRQAVLKMGSWNCKTTYLPLLFSARLNFLLASVALMRLLESKSSLFAGGSSFLPLRDVPA